MAVAHCWPSLPIFAAVILFLASYAAGDWYDPVRGTCPSLQRFEPSRLELIARNPDLYALSVGLAVTGADTKQRATVLLVSYSCSQTYLQCLHFGVHHVDHQP